MVPLLAVVWLMAGDVPPAHAAHVSADRDASSSRADGDADAAGPRPARHPEDPPAPELPPLPAWLARPAKPAPLPPRVQPQAGGGGTIPFDPAVLRRMAILPGAALGSGILLPAALGARNGDWGTPAVEMLAGYSAGFVGTVGTIGAVAAVEALGPVPDPEIGFNRGAAWVAVVGMAIVPPASTGLAVFHAGEGMQGRSRHRTENLTAAIGGALAAEALFAGAAIALRQPPATIANLLFIPMAAGATLGYELARGPHRGPRRAMFPVMHVAF